MDYGEITADKGALPVLYADAQIAVVNKPAGVMAHDSKLARGETDFVADRLRAQFGKPIFLIHRLDRATSGCLLVAFDRDSASTLGKVLMSREVEKDYLAVCRGWPEPDFIVDHPIDGGPGKPERSRRSRASCDWRPVNCQCRRAVSNRHATHCCAASRKPAASARSAGISSTRSIT
jgi:tRNA pseudouridine synthase C (EC 5.4.99.-)